MVKSKKNLLIISPTLPRQNMSAGDYRVFTLAKELRKYFKIFFMPLNYKSLEQKDINNFKIYARQIIKPALSADSFSKFLKNHNIDVCLFERYFTMPFDVCKLMPLAKISVVDVHEIGFVKTLARSKIKEIPDKILYKAKELLFYKNAKMLITVTDKEKKELRKYFPDKTIAVVPTCTKIGGAAKTFDERTDICYFGFFKHSPNADAVNYFSRIIFPKVSKKIPGVKFHILGYGSAAFAGKYDNVTAKDNIGNITAELSKYKVFVCPLRYGAGLKKKVLDAMAAKTPVVSTSFGTEGIKNLEKECFCLDGGGFVREIAKLYTKKSLWRQTAEKNFNTVKKYYSMQAFKKYVKSCVAKLETVF